METKTKADLHEEDDSQVQESFDTSFDLYLPNGVVLELSDMESAMHSFQNFRKKYPTGQMKVVRKERLTREYTIFKDG